MLTLTPDGADFIARWEGFRPTPYYCPAGHLTIGYGHLIQPGESFTRISEGEALDLLMRDAERNAQPVGDRLLHPLKPFQADALISMAFNFGGYRIARSTLVRRINEGNLSAAADEFPRWKYESGSVSRGLVKRRAAERRMFLFSDYSGAP